MKIFLENLKKRECYSLEELPVMGKQLYLKIFNL